MTVTLDGDQLLFTGRFAGIFYTGAIYGGETLLGLPHDWWSHQARASEQQSATLADEAIRDAQQDAGVK